MLVRIMASTEMKKEDRRIPNLLLSQNERIALSDFRNVWLPRVTEKQN